jgi:hypothetical protein
VLQQTVFLSRACDRRIDEFGRWGISSRSCVSDWSGKTPWRTFLESKPLVAGKCSSPDAAITLELIEGYHGLEKLQQATWSIRSLTPHGEL